METQSRLLAIAEELRQGKTVNPVTVREFLLWFGAQRRGYWIVVSIRVPLGGAKLLTEPDFESAYIDSPVTFKLAAQSSGPSEESKDTPQVATSSPLSLSASSVPVAPPSYADPTYRVSKLAAANKPPISVAPDATIQETTTLMLMSDFSQLPVMVGERDVKGMVSWTSVGTRLALGEHGTTARELMDPHQETRPGSEDLHTDT